MQDLANGLLVRSDGSLVGGVRVAPANLELLSAGELSRVAGAVHETVNAMQHAAQILSLPRPLDLESYMASLAESANQVSPARQRLLKAHMDYLANLLVVGEAQERRFYILIPQSGTLRTASDLAQAIHDLSARLSAANLNATPMDDQEWLSLLHVWCHPGRNSVEHDPTQAPAPIVRLEVQ